MLHSLGEITIVIHSETYQLQPPAQLHSNKPIERNTHHSSPNFLRMINRQHIRNSPIRPLKIITHINMIPNLKENDRRRQNKRRTQQRPVTNKFLFVGEFPRVEVIHDRRAAGLDSLVEADVVCRASARVGECAHEPDDVSPCWY